MKAYNLASLTIILFSTFRPSFIAISRVLHKLLAIIWNHLTNIHSKPHKMCKNVSVNNFLSTKDYYLKLSTITHNDILFPTVLSFWRHFTMTSFCDVMTDFLIFWELCQIWRVILAEILCHLIKTGKYVNLHCITFQNLQTELKYHDYSSTICILKRTHFLSRKCRKLGVSDDVIRKIVTSAKIF